MSIGTGSLPLSIGIISKCMEQKKGRIEWLDVAHPGFLVELVVTLVPASVVICFCLLISNVLRISPFYRLYLFGRK